MPDKDELADAIRGAEKLLADCRTDKYQHNPILPAVEAAKRVQEIIRNKSAVKKTEWRELRKLITRLALVMIEAATADET